MSAAPAPSEASETSNPTSTVAAGSLAAAPCGRRAADTGGYTHVIWIWMENHRWSEVVGDPSAAPYTATLATQCGTATDYATVGAPSLPNYVGATSGSTQGIADDGSPPEHRLVSDNLFRQVRTAGLVERSYEEAMSSPCQQNPSGRYAVKHNPAAYYTGGTDSAACQTDDVPFPALTADLAAGRLPSFAFVTPDLCDDTHDCGVRTGDAWLARWLPPILSSPAYATGTLAVFVVWDEYTPLPNVFVAPSVPVGTVVAIPVDHFSLLRTTEELLGLPLLGQATSAPSLRGPLGL
jgi:hypothetical protein